MQSEITCSCGYKNTYDMITIVEVLDGEFYGFCFFCARKLGSIYRYSKGSIPIPDTTFDVFTIKKNRFVKVGDIFVSGKTVSEEMDKHYSIMGYTPECVAKKLARRKYPRANPVIVTLKEVVKGGERKNESTSSKEVVN